jgi:glycosyltransferase involved in cell wall biosynthesis
MVYQNEMKLQGISVIVPARNAETTLSQCLEALNQQTKSPTQIIVVDDNSSDSTCEIARYWNCRLVKLPEWLGTGAARNAGARAAQGKTLLFIDSDVVVPKDTVAKVDKWLKKNPDYHGLLGILTEKTYYRNLTSEYFNLRKRFDYLKLRAPIKVMYGSIHAVRKYAFQAINGFDSSLRIAEDADLGLRLAQAGYKIGIDQSLEVIHLKQMTLRRLLKNDATRSRDHFALLFKKDYWKTALKERRVASFRGGAMLSAALMPIILATSAMSLIWDHIGWVAAGCIIILLILNWNFLSYTGRTKGPILAINFSWLIVLDMTAAAVGVIMGIISVLHGYLCHRLSSGTRDAGDQQ